MSTISINSISTFVDDDEFTRCRHCQSDLKPYHNTSLSDTPSEEHYTKTLRQYDHLNCEKCGVYIPIHPDDPTEASLIFVCSAPSPHPHCLCNDCGALYELSSEFEEPEEEEESDMVTQLMTEDVAQNTESCSIGSDGTADSTDTISATLLAANTLATMGISSNGTFVDMVSNFDVSEEMVSEEPTGNLPQVEVLWGTILAVMVWQLSPEMVRLSAIGVWFLCFYFLISLYFTDNEPVQDTVFSLLTFSPIIAAIFIFERTRRMPSGQMQEDARLSVQFLSAFGGAAYFMSYCSPLEVWFSMLELSALQRIIALFIAISVLGFMALLLKNCNFMWRSVSRECVTDIEDEGLSKQCHSQSNVVLVDFDLITKSDHVEATKVVAAEVSDFVSSVEPVAKSPVDLDLVKSKKKKRRRRRKKRGKATH